MGAFLAIASSTFFTGSSTSYSTLINLHASLAVFLSVAETAATACPLYKTFLLASIFSASLFILLLPSVFWFIG